MEKVGTETGLTVKSEMMSKLDIISKKLNEIKLVSETVYKTNGEIKVEGKGMGTFNLHRCNDLAVIIAVFGYLNTEYKEYETSAKELKLTNYPAFQWSGFMYEAWKHDIEIRVAQLTAKQQIDKLQKAKQILEGYMSQDDRLAIAMKEIDEMGI